MQLRVKPLCETLRKICVRFFLILKILSRNGKSNFWFYILQSFFFNWRYSFWDFFALRRLWFKKPLELLLFIHFFNDNNMNILYYYFSLGQTLIFFLRNIKLWKMVFGAPVKFKLLKNHLFSVFLIIKKNLTHFFYVDHF